MKERKFCILFNIDKKTDSILQKISNDTYKKYNHFIFKKEEGELPFHMTIIGGIKVKSELKIKNAVNKILPFQNKKYIPKLEDVEAVHLPGFVFGIRLKFKNKSYKITGDVNENKKLIKNLGAENFDFDIIRHITVIKIINTNDYVEIDNILKLFKKDINKNKNEIMKLKFYPEIWEKVENKWVKSELNHLFSKTDK